MKPLGIKWPQDNIKALGIFFWYDKKLLYLKNFTEKLEEIKKLINIWSSRGLSLYGKVTIIKSSLLPKVVYMSSLLPTPDVTKKKSKDYYSLFVRKKACFPNNARKLKCEFNLTDEALKKAFSLRHSVAFEPYVKAFQFKILNYILYTNSKLHKIGYIADYLCSFCKRESETMQHFFYDCSYSISFWKDFEDYYLSLTKQQIHLNLKDILIGLLTPELPLLNYLLFIVLCIAIIIIIKKHLLKPLAR